MKIKQEPQVGIATSETEVLKSSSVAAREASKLTKEICDEYDDPTIKSVKTLDRVGVRGFKTKIKFTVANE